MLSYQMEWTYQSTQDPTNQTWNIYKDNNYNELKHITCAHIHKAY